MVVADKVKIECAVDEGIVKDSPRKKVALYLKRRLGRRSSNESQGQVSCSTATTAAGTITQVKEVSFNLNANVVHNHEPLWTTPEEKKESFFDKEDLVESRQHGRNMFSSDEHAKTYINTFDDAYKQVLMENEVTPETLQKLIEGLREGYRGLEQSCGRSCGRRKKIIQQYVLSIVNLYHSETYGSETDFLPRNGSTGGMPQYSRNEKATSPSATAKTVRKLATNLSAGNRHFALLLGTADCMAVYGKDVEVIASKRSSGHQPGSNTTGSG